MAQNKKNRDAVTRWAREQYTKPSFIRVNNVFGNRYRVDVFTKIPSIAGGLIRQNKIAMSYFVALVDDGVVDLTIEQEVA